MSHKIIVTVAVLMFSLFNLPVGADIAAPATTQEDATIEIARDAAAEARQAAIISAKRAESLGSEEPVDCFYDANRYRTECDGTDSAGR